MDHVGLIDSEVKERVSSGYVNNFEPAVSRTYRDIIFKNAFTKFNLILFILGAALIYFEEFISAISATGIIIFNIMIATIQEIRAKRRLDKIALLLKPIVKVIRNGEEISVGPSKIVIDDIIHLYSGDQAQVDGEIIDAGFIEMDESLLTGESRSVRKHLGDTIYSGSFCITGEGYYKVMKLGQDTFASQMLSTAKKYKKKMTPLQVETTTITEILMSIATVFLGIMVLTNIILGREAVTAVEQAVIILDIVPIALFLLITVTYMIAAVRMANSGVLLQNSNSVESMSHVDTVCLDKTGTITTNNLIFEELISYQNDVEKYVRIFVSATGSKNRTIKAIINKLGTTDFNLLDEIQFSSERKYSAVKIKDGEEIFTLYMGAGSSFKNNISNINEIESQISEISKRGLRTVVFCKGPDMDISSDDVIELPPLTPLCLISIRDEIRKDCKEIIEGFISNGMDLKVISGDDPETIDALFSLANIPGERNILSGDQLDLISNEDFEKTIIETNIFGRMKPDQKEKIIRTLKTSGRYVLMVGDGVNDVRSLKAADVGVALQSGSGAARGVSDMVLVNDQFKALPKAVIEGKKTVTGMRDILRLYLTRNFVLAMLVGILLLVFHEMPLLLVQNAYYALITVSFAAFLMAIWAKPSDNKELILPSVLRFSIPTAILIVAFSLVVYLIFSFGTTSGLFNIPYEELYLSLKDEMEWNTMQDMLNYLGSGTLGEASEINARNAMLMFMVIAGISQLFLIYPMFKFLAIDGKVSRQLKPTILAFLLFGLVIVLYNYPLIAVGLGALMIFPVEYYILIIGLAMIWFLVSVAILKSTKLTFITDKFEVIFKNRLQKISKRENDKLMEDNSHP